MYHKQLDTFRFFAVILVLASHWLSDYELINHLHFGSSGVEFFFVISGFLISYQLFSYKEVWENRIHSFGKIIHTFFARRILRIFPLYYSVILINSYFNGGYSDSALPWNLLYVSNYYFIQIDLWPGNLSHLWSLSVEEHFYLFWPFVILLIKQKFLPIVMLGLFLFSFAFRAMNSSEILTCYIDTRSCLDLFMTGAFLAYLYKYNTNLFERFFSSTLVRISTLIFFILCHFLLLKNYDNAYFINVDLKTIFSILYGLIVGIVVIGFKGVIGEILEKKLLVHLGKLSYCIYLTHNFIPGMFLPIQKLHLHPLIYFIIYTILTIIISWIIYHIFENPIRKLNCYFVLEKEEKLVQKEFKIQSKPI